MSANIERLSEIGPRRGLIGQRHVLVGLVCVLLCLVTFAPRIALGQDTPTESAPAASASAPASAPAAKSPGDYFGAWVLIPPVVTIVLAIWWRQVIPALFIGTLIAAIMHAWVQSPFAIAAVALDGTRMAVEHCVLGSITNLGHAKIITFTLLTGAMIGIIAANGGTAAIVRAVAKRASNRRRGQLSTWLAGLLVFFDDYANAMIIGPAMRPVCDRLKISRAKLAYMVDSTAAPVASIALVGTWIGAEISYIQDGLSELTTRPDFLADMSAYRVFLLSIPYRFYAILAIVMVFLIGWLNRDFGPMLKAERELTQPDATGRGAEEITAARETNAWYAGGPVLVMLVVTILLIVITGWYNYQGQALPDATPMDTIQGVISNAESSYSILYGALTAAIVAAFISLLSRTLTLTETMEAATAAMTRMLPTLVILVLAWSLSSAMKAMELGQVANQLLEHAQLDVRWLPSLVFATACVVSFATGTSYGTMGIICPATIVVASGMLEGMPPAEALPIFYASVGAVLAGAVFGDHCSPISDTTVLSSLATSCSLELHVWTQIPYAVVVAVVATLSGDIMCRWAGLSPWIGLLAGSAMLLLVVLIFGRQARAVTEASD
ncbi:MAG: hypothetical protein JXO22_10780 [Phycisphaerae bacterium]|nr:hypothetical protein [Phycisphaerae bacterium]